MVSGRQAMPGFCPSLPAPRGALLMGEPLAGQIWAFLVGIVEQELQPHSLLSGSVRISDPFLTVPFLTVLLLSGCLCGAQGWS